MKRTFKYTLPFILSIFPFVTVAKVYINEVAWMGTEKSSYGEWIELYNDADSEVDLNNSEIFEGGGKTSVIKLTKKISSKGYYLIERVTPSTPDPIPETADDMGSFGGSGLGNSGEFLVIKSTDGTVLDSLDASTGWPAGDSITKQTMQRTDSGAWITATATPKAVNASVSNSNNSSENNSSQDSTSTSTEENSGDDETIKVDSITYDSSAYSSPFSLSQSTKEKRKIGLDVGRNRIALTDSPVFFVGQLSDDSGKIVGGASFDWSFGDGNTISGQNVSHIYRSPAEYVVIEKANLDGEEFVGKSLIKVVSPAFKISGAGKDGGDSYIEIENSLPFEANLKGWKLRSGFNTYIFPSDTIILSGKKVRFYSSTTKINSDYKGEIELVSSLGKPFSTFSNRESGKPVDNAVDKSKDSLSSKGNTGDNSVDNLGKSMGYLDQLSKMTIMLGEMRKIFVAEMPIGGNESLSIKKVKSIILNEELDKFEPSLNENSSSTMEDYSSSTATENKKIVTLDAPENKKGFWNYVISLFWQ